MAATASAGRRRRHRRDRHLAPLVAGGGAALAMAALVVYLLWPTWQAGALVGPRQLPITVGGMLFNVPSQAIRMGVQRRSGAQDRIDLAFAYPALTPPEPQARVSADTVEDTPIRMDHLILSIAVRDDGMSPDDRLKTIYPRYLDAHSATSDGLMGQAFLDASPYRGEDLFTSTNPPFAARCTRDAMTPGFCLSQRRVGDVDMTYRFPRAWLSEWRSVVAAMDRLLLQLHGPV